MGKKIKRHQNQSADLLHLAILGVGLYLIFKQGAPNVFQAVPQVPGQNGALAPGGARPIGRRRALAFSQPLKV